MSEVDAAARALHALTGQVDADGAAVRGDRHRDPGLGVVVQAARLAAGVDEQALDDPHEVQRVVRPLTP